MAQLLRVTKGQPYRLIPRHGITQSSGKQRVIDDAARGGQSERSQDANKLVSQHVALLAHFTLRRSGPPWQMMIPGKELATIGRTHAKKRWGAWYVFGITSGTRQPPKSTALCSLDSRWQSQASTAVPSWWKQWADDFFEYSSACTLMMLPSRTNSLVEHLPNGLLPR